MKLIILSGRSGAGKSVALRVLEDLGYYCVDNLPPELMPALLKSQKGQNDLVAVSLDIRNLPLETLDVQRLKQRLDDDIEVTIYYLDASDENLLRRYSETRRLHPLSRDGRTLAEAIATERTLLEPLAQECDHHIRTDDMSVHQLADTLRERLLGKPEGEMMLVFESFGFKHGMPKQADYMFDVRFLPNPHWDPTLRPLTGKDEAVKDYFRSQESVTRFVDHTERFLLNWMPMLERNNRAYLTVAIGCTGGQHRSVYVAEALAQRFAAYRSQVQVHHRELKEG
ncbi:RNase adapter RapZ [Ferrimonas balearica]|uniref:RNase adapter RapZ n=1 Tax=Ferrimonas balearica TaxID=44012 RepID=UPI001C98EFC9|nr:RNase adapter RapZ [Ferrimonas balearica]MBY5922477.1 RNase adapter RapZ [Ferrimonas balearica]MBY5995461.1 RNase adapter RapZ [Ferrimonas balearica]